jgi:hypothetical protein
VTKKYLLGKGFVHFVKGFGRVIGAHSHPAGEEST